MEVHLLSVYAVIIKHEGGYYLYIFAIPIANNIATADFMIHSTLMNEQYSHQIENFKNTVDVRVKEMQ